MLSGEIALRNNHYYYYYLSEGNIYVLALLDFSSAFDASDHSINVHRLNTDFGFTDAVLQWSHYLTDRTNYVSLSNHCSAFAPVHSGVPRGSVLGPIPFTMYIKPLSAIIDSHSIIHHSSIDDIQLLMSAPPDKHPGYFILCSNVDVMSKLGPLRTCLSIITRRQQEIHYNLVDICPPSYIQHANHISSRTGHPLKYCNMNPLQINAYEYSFFPQCEYLESPPLLRCFSRDPLCR